MDPLVLGIIIIAALAVLVVGVGAFSLRRNDTTSAIGQLSGETVKRDKSAFTPSASLDAPAPTGKEVEAAAKAGSLVVAASAPPVAYVPPDPETLGVARRQFLNRGILAFFVLGLSGFGAACLAFLWPSGGSGFGSRINVGRVADIEASIKAGGGFFYVPEGRMWITEYPHSAIEKATTQYKFFPQVEQGLKAGVTALYQTCPHLGCRVPECGTSQWFECPCHGSQYNRVGEKKGGPAPRGMDRFPMEVNAALELVVDTGTVIPGPTIGTNTTGQEAEGPHCIGGGSH
ncbi:MAG: Rieske 2Fe-2S domain-containing protein [Acidimicrobiales bacterium]